MNILITTFALLLVLNIGTSLFFADLKSCKEKIQAAAGFFTAAREGQNKLQQKRFASWKDTPISAVKALDIKPRNLRMKEFVSYRKSNPPQEQGRFHVGLLWKAETSNFTQKLLNRFVKELYGHAEWFDELKTARIIEALKDFGLKNQDSFTQTEFMETLDVDLYPLCYHIVKGTQTYDIEKKLGYPPLKDFFDFSICVPKHFCHFPFASIPFLRVLFGAELTEKILKIEEEKWEKDHRQRHCLKRELLELVPSSSRSAEVMNIIESYCNFSNAIGKRSFVQGAESKSGISVRYGPN